MTSASTGAGGTSTLTGTNLAEPESLDHLIRADHSQFLQKAHSGGRFESASPNRSSMA
jgi:hypothetical protein